MSGNNIPLLPQPVTILDWRDDSGLSDNLHFRTDRTTGCTYGRCTGSKVEDSKYFYVFFMKYF